MFTKLALLLCALITGYSYATGAGLAVLLGLILCTWLVLDRDPFRV